MNKFNVKSNVLRSQSNSHSNYNIISIHNNNNNNNNSNNKTTMKTATKMYLSIILSMVCIMFYQYQLSKANFITWQGGGTGNTNSVVTTMRNSIETNEPLPPPLYIITPTYRRPEQLAEITRLGNTLKHIPNLFWLVVEDATIPTALVTRQLQRLSIPFAHLVAPMPNKYKRRMVKPRGVSNRNRGLAWIRKNATEGVFYFADDDNTYDLEIFHQMRYTKKVSMWPVGLVTKFGLSSPIVKDGKMVGFYDGWIGGRRFPVDMAGFAVNIKFFLSRPKAIMPYDAGYEEDKFLRSLAPLNVTEIELLASNCTEILTWHTQTKKNAPATPLDMKKYNGTNLVTLRKTIV